MSHSSSFLSSVARKGGSIYLSSVYFLVLGIAKSGVPVHPWIPLWIRHCSGMNSFTTFIFAACVYYSGKDEGITEQMRSILAQFEFTNLVLEWTSKGVPFQTHLYVPEVQPVTNLTFCESEDEAHVLNVFFPH